jgi:hypothetical protein
MKQALLAIPTFLAASLSACAVSNPDTDEASWRDAIVASPSGADGCFHVSYPSMDWEPVACGVASGNPFASRRSADVPFAVGNGNDYAIQVSGLISKASGTFVKATDVTTETGAGTKNSYSLQLNSNFMTGTAACKGKAGCMSWEQFIYSTTEQATFMQNWLIGFGDTCPNASFMSDGEGDCFSNSAAVTVPDIKVADLSELKVSGKAVKGGNDSVVFAVGTEAFTTSEKDSITDLATAWNSAEYNIIGDGNLSEAVFNKGASIRVRIGVTDGSTTAPKCVANDGTTGETNNLTLGACETFAGTQPSIEFTESD